MNPIPWQKQYPLLSEEQLLIEQSVLRKAYPGFRLVFDGTSLSFRGPLTSNYGSTFQIEVRLPPRYPEQEPHLWVLSPTLPPATEHRYVDGRICAHASPYVPYRTTVATMISVMAGWIFRFERRRFEKVSWDVPLAAAGLELAVNPDGTLYLKEQS